MKKHKDYEVWKSYVVPGFSDIMINQLAKHGDRGDSWKDEHHVWLLARAKEELKEVFDNLASWPPIPTRSRLDSLARECADVANFMMMIADSVSSLHIPYQVRSKR